MANLCTHIFGFWRDKSYLVNKGHHDAKKVLWRGHDQYSRHFCIDNTFVVSSGIAFQQTVVDFHMGTNSVPHWIGNKRFASFFYLHLEIDSGGRFIIKLYNRWFHFSCCEFSIYMLHWNRVANNTEGSTPRLQW